MSDEEGPETPTSATARFDEETTRKVQRIETLTDVGRVAADGEWLPPDPIFEDLVGGRFRVHRQLGEGGVGQVFEGEQVELRRPVALKLLHPHLSANEGMRKRFHREARAASMLEHPGSVTIYDFGEWRGHLYIAMELLDGRELSDVIRDEHPLATERIIDLMVQLCEVLDKAHGMGLVHRDLKPANVMIVQDQGGAERVKVVDFGLATLVDPEPGSDMKLTRDGAVSGTPDYMSPEQARGQQLDERSDIYSVGVILYELLCAQAPFDGASPLDVMLQHLYATPTPPSQRERAGVIDDNLERIALWALEKAPSERPSSAAELKEALLGAEGAPGSRAPTREAEPKRLDREGRRYAAGIRTVIPRSTTDRPAVQLEAFVVQDRMLPFADSGAAVLRAHGARVEEHASLGEAADELARRPPSDNRVLVVDLRPQVSPSLDALAALMPHLTEGELPVVIVGPAGDFDVMTRALEIGAADYVPASGITKLSRTVDKAVRRALRRRKRKTGKG